MKSIYVTFEDQEITQLEKRKGKRSWRLFILEATAEKGGLNELKI